MCKATRPPSGMRVREPVRAIRAPLSDRLAAFGPSAKSVGRPLFLSYQFSPTFSHSPHSALGGRAEAASLEPFGGSSAALGNGSARFGPSAKSVGRPLFLLYQFSPTFPHSPHSALGGRAEGAEARFRRLERRARGTDRRAPDPLQKVSADPYFYSTSFPPLFPTLRTLGARGQHGRSPSAWAEVLGPGAGPVPQARRRTPRRRESGVLAKVVCWDIQGTRRGCNFSSSGRATREPGGLGRRPTTRTRRRTPEDHATLPRRSARAQTALPRRGRLVWRSARLNQKCTTR